jgi:hypothetical protein
MRVTTKLLSILIIALFTATPILIVEAKPALTVDLYRDWGFGMGNDIAGLFTVKATVSENTTFVEFYIDNQLKQNSTVAPYNWQFNTSNYTLGEHSLKVVAYDNSGESWTHEITKNFVEDNTSSILIVGVVIAVAITAIALVVAVYRIKKNPK